MQRIIEKRGLAFVSLREVARDARVSHSAPAHHFGNKAGLLTAFAIHGYELLAFSAMEEVKRAGGSGPDMLEASGRGYFRFAVENPELFGVMFRSELLLVESPEFSAAADGAFVLLTNILERCQREGYLAGADLEAIAAAAWAVAHGLANLWLGGRLGARVKESDGERMAARALRAFVDGTVRATKK